MVDSVVHADSLQWEKRRNSVELARVPPGIHPSYVGSWEQIRTTAKWNHKLAVAYRVSDVIVVADTSSLETQTSSTTDRSRTTRIDRGGVNYLMPGGVRFSLNFKRQLDTDRPAGELKNIDERGLTFVTALQRKPWEGAELSMSGGGTLSRRDKTDEKPSSTLGMTTRLEQRTGLSGRGSVNFEYKIGSGMKLKSSARLVSGRTRIETSGNTIETSVVDGNRNDSREARVSFNMRRYDFARVAYSSGLEKVVTSFANVAGSGVEETTDKRFRNSVRVEGELTKRLKYEGSVRFNKAQRRYAIDAGKSSDRLELSSDLTLRYKLPSRIRSVIQLERSRVEDTYFPDPGDPDRTGRTERGQVAVNLSRSAWASTNLAGAASILMTRRVLADSTQDKDDLSRRLTFSLDHKPKGKNFSGEATISVDEAQTVNIHSSRSGNNQTRQTWALTPAITYNPTAVVSLRSAYNLRLVYVFNDANSSRNTMNRIRELRSTGRWSMTSRSTLSSTYRFKVDEKGRFEEEGSTRRFLRDGETSTQKLSLNLRFEPGWNLKLRSGQSIEVTKRYDIGEKKELLDSTSRMQILNQVDWSRDLPKSSTFRLTAKQIQNAQIPVFKSTGSLGKVTRKIEWEVRTSLNIKL